jgi:flavin-dependent dehydrogenase
VASVKSSGEHGVSFGPPSDVDTVAIVGGGPAGVACALTVLRLSRDAGRRPRVVVFEGKRFGGHRPHYNQCVGVLSPPIQAILGEELGVPFPGSLVCQPITGYVLHSDRRQIDLGGDGRASYAVRRVEFDDYLLEAARGAGVEVVQSRVQDLEFHADRAVVYSDSVSLEAAVVVGAFGLDDGSVRVFERATAYRSPQAMTSVVTKIHAEPDFLAALGPIIHAFLPSIPEIEFGAITPKSDHLTINIAGRDVDSAAMGRFLRLPAVGAILPIGWSGSADADRRESDQLWFYRGRFPMSVADGICGDRYIVVGDAAGLIRPFKGKGINAGLRGGIVAGEAIVRHGVSAIALRDYLFANPYARDVLDDRPYALALRLLANLSADLGFLDCVIEVAEGDARLRQALFDAVSAHNTYRQVAREAISPGLVYALARAMSGGAFKRVTASWQREVGPATLGASSGKER